MPDPNDAREVKANSSADDPGTSGAANGQRGPLDEHVGTFVPPKLHAHQHWITLAGVLVTTLVFGVMAYSLWLQRDFGRRQLSLIQQQRDISHRLAEIEATAVSPFIRPTLDSVRIFTGYRTVLLCVAPEHANEQHHETRF